MREHQTLKFWLADEQQTRQAGAALAAALVPAAEVAPVVIFVRGDLGAGKSTLVRGFLTRAGVTGVMPSPTYSLVEPYQSGDLKIFHMDAYRLADATELDYLGLDDIDAPGSILLVEWPDHIRDALPKPTLTLDLSMSPHPDEQTTTSEPGQAQPPISGNALDEPGQAQTSGPKPGLVEPGQAQRPFTGSEPGQAQVSRRENSTDLHQDRLVQTEECIEKISIKTTAKVESVDIGRLLSVTLNGVPVQLWERIEASKEWKELFRVVT